MSFELVNHITSIQPGERGTGIFTAPPAETEIPIGFLVEAIGQLASWVAMPKFDFEFRPVAASAGLVTLHQKTIPTGPLELEIEITSMRHQALSYHGSLSRDGEPYLSLERAVGPLLPIEGFDDRDRVAQLFHTLCTEGLPSRPLVPQADYQPAIQTAGHRTATGFSVTFKLPAESAIYADHFPRQPVFPATLLLQCQIDQARQFYRRDDGTLPNIARVSGVKVRAFSGPGELLSLQITPLAAQDHLQKMRLETWREDVRISTAMLYLNH